MLRDSKGDKVWGFKVKIGIVGSFMAEPWSLREGLRISRDKGFQNIVLEVDLKSVVDVLTGGADEEDWACNLVDDCKFMIESLCQVKIVHMFTV